MSVICVGHSHLLAKMYRARSAQAHAAAIFGGGQCQKVSHDPEKRISGSHSTVRDTPLTVKPNLMAKSYGRKELRSKRLWAK
jgi:hypothetical protein